MTNPVRVRIAPSPSGHLHIGTARTAVYNWLFARHHGGTFILRIEDTDAERSFPEYVESIQRSLEWLGLKWDEGPYFQSQRQAVHAKYVDLLRHSGNAYPCYCTPDELAAKREAALREKKPVRYDGHCRELTAEQRAQYEAKGRTPALRLRIGPGETVYQDLVYGEMKRAHEELDDFICVRADGSPVYNFACVIDDHDMRISHVIRGNDHQTNTFKQILLYNALGLEPPRFAHLPLNLGTDRRKISKREGATSITEYQQEGFLADALINFLALLGWSPGDDREVMSRSELIEAFTLDRVNPANPVFDRQKLEWMNGEYIRRMDPNDLLKLLTPVLMEAGLTTRLEIETRWQWMLQVVRALQERLHLLTDIVQHGSYFFTDKFEYDPKGVRKQFRREGTVETLRQLIDLLQSVPDDAFTKDTLEEKLRTLAESQDRKPADFIHPLRLSLSGLTGGPGIFDLLELLGKERCVKRIETAIAYIEALPPEEKA